MFKQAVLLIVPNGFRDEEYAIPKNILEDSGIKVLTVSTKLGELTGKKGLTVATVDTLLGDLRSQEIDALVIVGGQDYYWHNEQLIALIKELDQQQKIIGAICISACIPAQAGVMAGRKATVFSSSESDQSIKELTANGATYVDQAVVVDGNYVTGRDVDSSKQFALEIVRKLLM